MTDEAWLFSNAEHITKTQYCSLSTNHISGLDGILLQILVICDILADSVLNNLGLFLTIRLGPLLEEFLISVL